MKTRTDGSDTTISDDKSDKKESQQKNKITCDRKTSYETNNNNKIDDKKLEEIKFNGFKENDIKEENNNKHKREEQSNPFLKNFQLRKTNSIYW